MAQFETRKGATIFVDDEDFDRVSRYSWRDNGDGYFITTIANPGKPGKRMNIYLHRFVSGLVVGDSREVDHKDLNKANNRRDNLRICTRGQNECNKGLQSNNKSGFKGVCRFRNKWRADIKLNRKTRFLGLFDTPEEAYAARCAAAQILHGAFANDGPGRTL